MQVTPEDINYVARLVDQLCGVVLDGTKGYLVESRLSGNWPRDQGWRFRELCDRARPPATACCSRKSST